MPRLFTALEIPEDIGDELLGLQEPLTGANWNDADNYHLTLRFAGEIDNRLAREFSENLSDIVADAFELRINGLGVFGGDDPKTVWAGFDRSPQLDVLARAHDRAARNAGIPPEKRPFKPHVTLARLRYSNAEAVAQFLTHFGGYRSKPFVVTRFVLMSSKPSTGGGPYVVKETFPLLGGGYLMDDETAAW